MIPGSTSAGDKCHCHTVPCPINVRIGQISSADSTLDIQTADATKRRQWPVHQGTLPKLCPKIFRNMQKSAKISKTQ